MEIKTEKWIKYHLHFTKIIYTIINLYFEEFENDLSKESFEQEKIFFENAQQENYRLLDELEIELSSNMVNSTESQWIGYYTIINSRIDYWKRECDGLNIDLQIYRPKKKDDLKYKKELIRKFSFLINIFITRINDYFLKSKHSEFWESVEVFKDSKAGVNKNVEPKLKWLGNISHLGYIIYQLAEKGFIEFPVKGGETNYTGLAERVLNGFEFEKTIPNKKYLSEQINPESENNKIADATKTKLTFDIPYRSDLH